MKIRTILASALLASSALAAPPLTTIQDVLYKADGTRFNGTVMVSWTSFQAADQSAIATQSTTVKILDGNLRIQLVPTASSTPASYYTAKYDSDGRVQFTETWSVPSSAQPVRLRDVRVATAGASTGTPAADTGGVTVPIPETDVTGLIADLSSRPVKGAGFAAGRVAVVDSLGVLESATGNSTDCIHVDGSSSACGGTAPSFVDSDTLTGIVDGSNTSFTLSNAPNPAASLAVYRNGMLDAAGVDYTVNGAAIRFLAASTPQPGDTLLASYRIGGSGGTSGGAAQAYPSSQILCGGTGGSTSATALASIGTCAIPGGLLAPGDRVEILFDLQHQGAAGGYTFQVVWGGTTIVQRAAAVGDAMVSARADAGIQTAGAQLSHQSWGSILPFAVGVVNATDPYAAGITINFQGMLAQSGDTLTLGGYSVVRLP